MHMHSMLHIIALASIYKLTFVQLCIGWLLLCPPTD